MLGEVFASGQGVSLEDLAVREMATPTAGEYLGLHIEQGFDFTLPGRAIEEGKITAAEKEEGTYDASYLAAREAADMYGSFGDVPEPKHAFAMTEAEWKTSEYYHKEIKYQPDMTPTRARILHENFLDRRVRDEIIHAGDQSFGLGIRALGFGAMMLGALPDPINLVSFGSGAAAGMGRAGLAALAGQTTRQAIWQGTKAGMLAGAREGALGSLVTDALVFPDLIRKGEDLGFADVCLDMVFGAALGSGLGGIGGGLGGWLGKTRADRLADMQTRVDQVLADMQEEMTSRTLDLWDQQRLEREWGTMDNGFLDQFGNEPARADFDATPDSFLAPDDSWLRGSLAEEIFTESVDSHGNRWLADERRARWQEWTEDFRAQLEEAGFTREQAIGYGNILGAHAETMGELFGLAPQDWLNRRLAGFRQVDNMADLRQAELEFGADVDTLYMAPMKRSDATDIGSFLAEARNLQADEQKKFFHIGQAHHDGTLQNVELGSDTVRHIDRRHPGFAEHERIADVIEHGKATYIGESKYTKGPAFVYILNEGESSLAVIASPVSGGKNRPPRFVTLSAFRDSTVGIEHWLSRFDGLSSPGEAGHSLNAWGSHASLPSEDALKGHQKEAVKNFITSMDEEVKALQIKPASDNNTMYQMLGEQGDTGFDARGAYLRNAGDGQSLIAMFQGKADISTVIHEGAGHFFLENLREAAQLQNAPAWVRDGWQDVARAIGADVNPSVPVGTDSHELFARMATEYFREGKAPNSVLEKTFKSFARWLTKIWRAITRRGDFAQITPEVRRVMDKLLGTEDDLRARAARENSRALDAARNDNADLLRAGLGARDRRDLARAMETALADLEAGRPVDVGPILENSGAGRAAERTLLDDGAGQAASDQRPDFRTEADDTAPPAPPLPEREPQTAPDSWDPEWANDLDSVDGASPEARQGEAGQADAGLDPVLAGEIDNLANEGRLSETDQRLLTEVDENTARAQLYDELGQSAVECVWNG